MFWKFRITVHRLTFDQKSCALLSVENCSSMRLFIELNLQLHAAFFFGLRLWCEAWIFPAYQEFYIVKFPLQTLSVSCKNKFKSYCDSQFVSYENFVVLPFSRKSKKSGNHWNRLTYKLNFCTVSDSKKIVYVESFQLKKPQNNIGHFGN